MTDGQLYLVFGGKVSDPRTTDFVDASELDTVGIYPTYEEAKNAWKGASQSKVDDAMTKYVVVCLDKLLYPEDE
ncbi:DUF4170 domain-containing protein [Pseudemcibacter aquimaris]|uniref:DUF4170 domain-containing protein n=1 Tax=Pseudemcibacter aquimaris TaxID=2857064 RepID=UPI002010F96B|nr:DUF4170 domain-containing protein [Pseudemcibacter aquimaris]MCC3860786.1 DUF4170 domain-containing protein [Pseudemcibacter aquimaris]WDU59606.1 DUF4170 domain-containing protein [Pseudemcibacter aquimaris]